MSKRGISQEFYSIEKNLLKRKKSQITVFVIIAIIIIAAIAGVVIFKEKLFPKAIPSSLVPVYDYYISCIEKTAKDGASIIGSQAGYIKVPEFEPGSVYAPYSNQLGFMGLGIPYWYYISGNNIAKEQIPTQKQMQEQLSDYIKNNLGKCDFIAFENQGFNITIAPPEEATVKADIQESKIKVAINQKLIIAKGEEIFTIDSHAFELDSRLGKFYEIARKIYDYEKNNMFLENYTVDVLYAYAPVSGVEFNCSPIIWNPYEIFDRLKNALNANIQMLKIQGDYYDTKGKYSNYFVVARDANINLENAQVSFLYMPDWPSRFEVWPTRNNLMNAEPIGTQQGLSAMGFCYAPYKFAYDIYIPVLVQIYNPNDASEIFQFPVAVVIKKNVPREALPGEAPESIERVCDNANTEISVYTYNVYLEPVEADISFKCLNDVCDLGKTKIDNETGYAVLEAKVPQCLNGVIIAKSDGYSEKRQLISTNTETEADIVLSKEYNLNLEIYVDNSLVQDLSVLTITKKDENTTEVVNSVAYPFNKELKLSEGYYNFDLKAFKGSSVVIPETTTKQCVKVPREGVLGFLGLEEEKCFDITIPSQKLTNVAYAGGNTDWYITSSELENAKTLRVYATSIKIPSTLEAISSSYDEIQTKNLIIEVS